MLRTTLLMLGLAAAFVTPTAHAGGNDSPYPGTQTIKSAYGFTETVARLEKSIEANKMGLVARASASAGAAARGVTIPGNAVLMVFRNDYAVRMLAASIPAGVEAPIRIYVIEGADSKASVTYRRPTAVFAPYANAQLDDMAKELDPVFARIVEGAVE
jgi:uncharacterized protein (DUF302 family)